jgi:hypothetical protein
MLKLVLYNEFLVNMGSSLLFKHWKLIRIILCFESNNLMIFRCCFIDFRLNILFILLYINWFIFILDIVSIFFAVLLDHCYPWIVYILNYFAFITCCFLCFILIVAVLSWNIGRKKHFNLVSGNDAIGWIKLLVLMIALI